MIPNRLSLSVAIILTSISSQAFAKTLTKDEPVADLGVLKVAIKKRLTTKSEETTGLGKTVKTADDINKNQILSVKDLVKDTPGVAVVEQGRGASSGFTIRGMDKNRVAVSVDGINQVQSYLVQKRQFGDGREGSGAINEIEIENISGMQISQGASGTESGSGALGGAVSFGSKNIDDIVKQDKTLGATHKSAYSSRDKQWLHSLGLGMRYGNFDGFVQYTDRKKHAVEPHKDIYNTHYQVWRWDAVPDDDPKRQFVIIDECPSYKEKDFDSVVGCAKPKLKLVPTLQDLSANDYTGDKRVLGDPMDYSSGSYFGKIGYNFGKHRLESVFERTIQNYNTQDMTKHAYHLVPVKGQGNLAQSPLVYRGQAYNEGVSTDAQIGAGWTQTQFFDEKHTKNRLGLNYRYIDPSKTGLFDEIKVGIDKQTVGIDHLQFEKYCTLYPNVDKHCQAGFDKPNSAQIQNRKIYTEKHALARADFAKTIKGDVVRHRLSAGLGLDKFSSNLWLGDIKEQYYHLDFSEKDYIKNPKGGFVDIYTTKNRYDAQDVCNDPKLQNYVGEARKCGDRLITGHNVYATLKDTMYFGSLANLSLGVRYDRHKFNTDDSWTGSGVYKNLSWNAGLVVKPTDYLDIAYRASTGYRVPSFKELFGYRLDGLTKGENDDAHYRTNARPEKALNQEIGVSLKHDMGNLDVSYFDNRYKDLIDLTLKNDGVNRNGLPRQSWGYRNYQDVRLAGLTLGGKLYVSELWDKAPVGLTAKFAYQKTKVKSNQIKNNFVWASGYFLDTISPARYVLGFDYTADNDKWGMGANWIITDPKNNDELATLVLSPSGESYEKKATKVSSSGWSTLDLSAFYRPNEHITLRAGINNVLNYRYSPWESLRQTSVTSGNVHSQGLPAQYAASGRNFVLSLESKW